MQHKEPIRNLKGYAASSVAMWPEAAQEFTFTFRFLENGAFLSQCRCWNGYRPQLENNCTRMQTYTHTQTHTNRLYTTYCFCTHILACSHTITQSMSMYIHSNNFRLLGQLRCVTLITICPAVKLINMFVCSH